MTNVVYALILWALLQQDPEIDRLLKTLKPYPTYTVKGTQVDITCPDGCPTTVVFTKLPQTQQIMVYSLKTTKSNQNVILLRFPRDTVNVKLAEFLSK